MAQDTTKKQQFVGRLQSQCSALLDLYTVLVGTTTEAAALGYGAGGTNPVLDAETGQPQIDQARLNAALASLAAVNQFLTANGHLTNLLALRP